MLTFFSSILNFPYGALRARGPSILGGVVVRYDFTVEETAKGALHGHGQVKIDGFDIRHLRRRLADPTLRRRLFAAMDSVVRLRKPEAMKSHIEQCQAEMKGESADVIHAAATVRADKERVPITYPLLSTEEERGKFVCRVLKAAVQARKAAAGTMSDVWNWSDEEDKAVAQLVKDYYISSLLPPPDSFAYWVRLGHTIEDGDVCWSRSDPAARHVLCGTITLGDEMTRARDCELRVELLETDTTSKTSSLSSGFALPAESLCRPTPTLDDLQRHHAESRGRDHRGCQDGGTVGPELSTTILQARLPCLESPLYAQTDPAGGTDDTRHWCEAQVTDFRSVQNGDRGDRDCVEVHRIERVPLSAIVVCDRKYQPDGLDPSTLVIGTRCQLLSRGPVVGGELNLTGTIIGSVGTMEEDESAYAGTVDTYPGTIGGDDTNDEGVHPHACGGGAPPLDTERLLERSEAFVRVRLDRPDVVALYNLRFFRQDMWEKDLEERYYHGVQSSQKHRYPCQGTCHKNQLHKPKNSRVCRLGYLLLLINSLRRHELARGGGKVPGSSDEDNEVLEGVLQYICDSPHLVPHNVTCVDACGSNQCWKWLSSGKGAKGSCFYNTKYITKNELGDKATVLNLVAVGLVKLREELAATDRDLATETRQRRVQRVARRSINCINGNYTVTAVMAALHWLNKGEGHFSSHEMKYLPLWPFRRRGPSGDNEDENSASSKKSRRRRRLPRSAPIEVGNNRRAVQVTWLDDYNQRHGFSKRAVKEGDGVVVNFAIDTTDDMGNDVKTVYNYKATVLKQVAGKPGQSNWKVRYTGLGESDNITNPSVNLHRSRQGGINEGRWNFLDEVTFNRYDERNGLVAPRNRSEAVRHLSPFAYALAFHKEQRSVTAKTRCMRYDDGHEQSKTHVQVKHPRPVAVSFSPYHLVPRRPAQFWDIWILARLDVEQWVSMCTEERESIGSYAEFVVRAFVPYMDEESLLLEVEWQTTHLPRGAGVSLASSTLDLEWLRLLRGIVRCRTPAGSDKGVRQQESCPPAISVGNPSKGRILLRSWNDIHGLRLTSDQDAQVRDIVCNIAGQEFGACGDTGDGWRLEPSGDIGEQVLVDCDATGGAMHWQRSDDEEEATCEPLSTTSQRPLRVRIAQFRPSLVDALMQSGVPQLAQVAVRCFRESAVVIGDGDGIATCVDSSSSLTLRKLFSPSRGSPDKGVCPVDAEATEGRGTGVRDEWLEDGYWRYVLGNYQSLHEGSDEGRVEAKERQAQEEAARAANPNSGPGGDTGISQWDDGDESANKDLNNALAREIVEAQHDIMAGGAPPNYNFLLSSTKTALKVLRLPANSRELDGKARDVAIAKQDEADNLFKAVDDGSVEDVNRLIADGAAIDIVNNQGRSLMQIALDGGQNEIVAILNSTAASEEDAGLAGCINGTPSLHLPLDGPQLGVGDDKQYAARQKRVEKERLSSRQVGSTKARKRKRVMHSRRVYIDLDSVIAVVQPNPGANAATWKRLKQNTGRLGFFGDVSPSTDGIELWNSLCARITNTPFVGQPYALTSILEGCAWAEGQKRAWCSRELDVTDEFVIVSDIGKETAQLESGDVLITANQILACSWRAQGGLAVEHVSSNGTLGILESMEVLHAGSTSMPLLSPVTTGTEGATHPSIVAAGISSTASSSSQSYHEGESLTELQRTLREGAIDKNTGARSPVTVEQGRGLCRMIENAAKRVQGEAVKPLRMIAFGPPGTGKSVLVDGFRDHARRCGWNIEDRFRFTAPTGKAAQLIGGNTLACLAGNAQYSITTDKLRKYWSTVWLLIIDEVFMVGLRDLGIAWTNVLKIIDDYNIDVVLVGDPFQFGPVSDNGVYKSSFYANHASTHARSVFIKQYSKKEGEWGCNRKAGWEFYRTFDPVENPEQGCVIWLDKTKRTEGHHEWNAMMHLLRTFFRETVDGKEVATDDRREKVEWVHTGLAKMVVGTKDRPEAEWQSPLVITPRRQVSTHIGWELLKRDAEAKSKRVVRYVSVELVRGGKSDGKILKEYSPALYAKVGATYSKKKNIVPREFICFEGARMVIPLNSTDDVYKLNGWVNGCQGEVAKIVLDTREPPDDFEGPYRELRYPPIYVLFQPFQHVKGARAKFFLRSKKSFDFDIDVSMNRGSRRANDLSAPTTAQVKLSVRRLDGFELEQGYAVTDICSQGSTYVTKVLVDGRQPRKLQSWYIALTRSNDPSMIGLLDEITLDKLLAHAGLDDENHDAHGDINDDNDKKGGGADSDDGDGKYKKKNVAGTRRDILAEASRLKRLALVSRGTYPKGGMRQIDPVWYDAVAEEYEHEVAQSPTGADYSRNEGGDDMQACGDTLYDTAVPDTPNKSDTRKKAALSSAMEDQAGGSQGVATEGDTEDNHTPCSGAGNGKDGSSIVLMHAGTKRRFEDTPADSPADMRCTRTRLCLGGDTTQPPMSGVTTSEDLNGFLPNRCVTEMDIEGSKGGSPNQDGAQDQPSSDNDTPVSDMDVERRDDATLSSTDMDVV